MWNCLPSLASSLTGIDEYLMHRSGIILQVLSRGYAVSEKVFKNHALDTAN